MRAASLALLTLVLVGCPKQVDTTRVAGSDDEQLATYEARLEELRSRGAGGETSCEERCTQATQTCEVAEDFCELVARHPDRGDLTRRCVQAQESCAETTDGCTRCRAR
jgi:methylaspartate ammonia-lyase